MCEMFSDFFKFIFFRFSVELAQLLMYQVCVTCLVIYFYFIFSRHRSSWELAQLSMYVCEMFINLVVRFLFVHCFSWSFEHACWLVAKLVQASVGW